MQHGPSSEIKFVSLYIDFCNCLILICSIQHQMKVNLWKKNSYRLELPKNSSLKASASLKAIYRFSTEEVASQALEAFAAVRGIHYQ